MMCCKIQIEFPQILPMLATPPPSHLLATSNLSTPSSTAFLLRQLLSIVEQLITLLENPQDKENRQQNAVQVCPCVPFQLSRCRQILSEGRELAGSLENAPNIKMVVQIKQQEQTAITAIITALKNQLQNIKTANKERTLRGREIADIDAKVTECIKSLEILSAANQAKTVKSEKHSSKRSLLTEKIRQAEREQSQSQLFLQTIRANPRVYGNIIEHTKIRDRTAPLNARTLDSLLKAQKFSFSEISESIPVLQQEQAKPSRGQSSRILLTEMSELLAGDERKAGREVGCARCEIY